MIAFYWPYCYVCHRQNPSGNFMSTCSDRVHCFKFVAYIPFPLNSIHWFVNLVFTFSLILCPPTAYLQRNRHSPYCWCHHLLHTNQPSEQLWLHWVNLFSKEVIYYTSIASLSSNSIEFFLGITNVLLSLILVALFIQLYSCMSFKTFSLFWYNRTHFSKHFHQSRC